jgi:hypothetical protein
MLTLRLIKRHAMKGNDEKIINLFYTLAQDGGE